MHHKSSYLIGLLVASLLFLGPLDHQKLDNRISATLAYGDGLAFETLPPNVVAGKPLALFIKIDPTLMTTIESNGNASLYMRLFDANDNQTINNVAYLVTISKDGSKALEEIFSSIPGPLTINFKPDPGIVQVFGSKDAATGWWQTDRGAIEVRAPVALKGGLYEIDVAILQMNGDSNNGNGGDNLSFQQDDAPTFTSWLSIGDLIPVHFEYSGISYNASIISYYERITDHQMDPTGPAFYWAMPFDWDLERISNQTIFVHEEIIIPKSFISELDSMSFAASINGIFLTRAALAIDPYSSESDMTIHFILPKAALVELATIRQESLSSDGESESGADLGVSNTSNSTDQMVFGLIMNSERARNETARSSSSLVTDTGLLGMIIEWGEDNQPSSAKPEELKLQFFDALRGGNYDNQAGRPDTVNYDVRYDLGVSDNDGNEVLLLRDLVAVQGRDQRTILFPEDGIYNLKIIVTGTRASPDADWTLGKNGAAFGVAVVPEFPSTQVALPLILFTLIMIVHKSHGFLPKSRL